MSIIVGPLPYAQMPWNPLIY